MRAETETLTPVYFQHRAATGALSNLIELVWYWSGHPRTYERERVLPMTTVELVIQLQSPRVSHSGLTGPRSEPLFITRQDTDQFLGIHFKPGGALPFIGCAFGELHNANVTIVDLWGEKRARRLLDLLNQARTVELKFQLLERWLTWIADRPFTHHRAVSLAFRDFQDDPGLLSVAKVAEKANLSQRRFIELFRDETGMTPKLFCRVQRFQAAISRIAHQTEVDWVDLALSLGYSDQSHFIHDFKEFSGLRPTEYLPLRTESLSHVRVPE